MGLDGFAMNIAEQIKNGVLTDPKTFLGAFGCRAKCAKAATALKQNRCHRVAITCEAGAGEKPAKRSSRNSLMNCLCRETKAELKMQNEIGRNGNAI
jgi:hypothetical protein